MMIEIDEIDTNIGVDDIEDRNLISDDNIDESNDADAVSQGANSNLSE